jgi:hypothetical protein
LIKTSFLLSVIALTMTRSALSSVIEPEDTYEKYVSHYKSGYYFQSVADFALDSDSQKKRVGLAVALEGAWVMYDKTYGDVSSLRIFPNPRTKTNVPYILWSEKSGFLGQRKLPRRTDRPVQAFFAVRNDEIFIYRGSDTTDESDLLMTGVIDFTKGEMTGTFEPEMGGGEWVAQRIGKGRKAKPMKIFKYCYEPPKWFEKRSFANSHECRHTNFGSGTVDECRVGYRNFPITFLSEEACLATMKKQCQKFARSDENGPCYDRGFLP